MDTAAAAAAAEDRMGCETEVDDARHRHQSSLINRCSRTSLGADELRNGHITSLPQHDVVQSDEEIQVNLPLVDLVTDDNLGESTCYTSRRQPNLSKELPKHVRKYYKQQNSLIDAYEQIQQQMQDEPDTEEYRRTAVMASILSKITLFVNLMLLVAKGVAAGLSGSLVVISSMLDSAMDLVSGVLMWWSNRAIKRTNYFYYPRGRRKLEPVAIVILAVTMSFVSVQVVHESLQKIIDYVTHNYDQEMATVDDWLAAANATSPAVNWPPTAPNWTDTGSSVVKILAEMRRLLDKCARGHGAPVFETPTIVICVMTIVAKLVLFIVCRRVDNPSVQALAKDHFNDVISNTGAIACGLIGYYLWKYADPIGAIIISVSIIINWSITAHGQIKMLTGYTAHPDFLKKITWIALRHDDRIRCIERVIAFHFGTRYLVEVQIVLPADMALREAHDVSETLQHKIERLPGVERAFIHTDYESEWLQDRLDGYLPESGRESSIPETDV